MSGPAPLYRPTFPPEFLAQAQDIVRRRTVAYQRRQRARLVLLLHHCPALSNVEAGARLDLHPNSVRLWRQRWAGGDFTLEDQARRGCKPTFSPPG